MRWALLIPVVGIVALTTTCDRHCGSGTTCPFAEPTHQAVVQGVVLDTNDQPLTGIHTSVEFEGQVYSGVGTLTDAQGRFTATARGDFASSPPDTVHAWVHAIQANPPPAQIIRDSVPVLLHFKPRSQTPQIVHVTIHLGV